jgi:hypothetical protein
MKQDISYQPDNGYRSVYELSYLVENFDSFFLKGPLKELSQ